MPDFTVELSPVALAKWVDPPTADAPSRLNVAGAREHTYLKVAPEAALVARARVGGVLAPADVALDGRLFQVWFAQWSGPYKPVIVAGAGTSSVSITLRPVHLGYFALVFYRVGGGSVTVPFNVEA